MNKMHLSKIRINESLDGTSFFVCFGYDFENL